MGNIRKKIEFPGSTKSLLNGLLELPSSGPGAYVLFAHCFTCGKDVVSASRISRALVARGFAVMRFDFTGLGSSDGDFSNTNFSSNVEDLICAAQYLRQNYLAPALLIGHSLGTAILRAAHKIPESAGVVTIGAPSEARHVLKQFSNDVNRIEQTGEAEVSLAGRTFTIKKQFIDDVFSEAGSGKKNLKKALLVFHSPLDTVVSIKEAEKIYKEAKHPKSFISLDQADHLLTDKKDADYVADTIAAWATRFISNTSKNASKQSAIPKSALLVQERNHVFTQNITSDHHYWLADEPVEVGGADLGPDPYEHLLAALGSCTAMTVRMYADRKKWPLDDVSVMLSHNRLHGEDCKQCDNENAQMEQVTRLITLEGKLSTEQEQRLLDIADRCPVHKTLHGKVIVETILKNHAVKD